jgi:tetratricopeptide (TPR) repeat protein
MRITNLWQAAVLTAGVFVCNELGWAQSMPGMDEHAHHHHADAEKLGAVNFPVSCSPEAAHGVEHGVALLHSFGYAEARMQFEDVVKAEPGCAMAHWGVAMTQFTELWGHPEKEALKLGADEMAEARKGEAKVTPRERGYIDALSAFYAGGPKTTYQQRADAYRAKMDALRVAYPQDVEAAAFDALAILASTPQNDTSLTHEREALAILVPLFEQHPDHPGLAHYIIHTCDTPALAQDGLSAAEEYAKIAPSSAHALHMPAHIFARLGMWQDDIASNEASVRASEKAEAEHEPGAAHQMHADEFLVYAYLQTGRDRKAEELTAKMDSISRQMKAMSGMDDMKDAGPFFANELAVITPMEMRDWTGLAGVRGVEGAGASAERYISWGHAVAAGHLRDPKMAAAALKEYDAAEAEVARKYPESAGGPHVKRDEMVGWEEFAEGHGDAAEAAMRRAADQQDKVGQGEVDIPAREMLGDLLMMEGKPAAALKEYRVALRLSPNRLNGLLSAGAAAEKAGDLGAAQMYYRAVAKQTDDARFSSRPELVHAVKMVGTDVAAR